MRDHCTPVIQTAGKLFWMQPAGIVNRKLILLFALFLFGLQNSWAQTSVFVFDTPGNQTWIIPPGTSRIQIEVWGGGANGTLTRGGNGGDYVRSPMVSFTDAPMVSTLSINVGGAGQESSVFFNGQDRYYIALGGKNDGTSQSQFGFVDGRIYLAGGTGGITRICGFGGVAGGGGGGSAFTNNSGNNGESGFCSLGLTPSAGAGGSGTGNGGSGAQNINGENGFAPGGGGGGGGTIIFNPSLSKSPGLGAPGRVKISTWCDNPDPGIIGNAHTIVSSPERMPDFVTNINAASGSYWGQLAYRWQRKTQGTSWVNMGSIDFSDTNGVALEIPPLRKTTYFRRIAIGCGNFVYTDSVRIKISDKNGNISGLVESEGGVGVQGITIKARKKQDLKGSKADFEYTTVTNSDGSYNIPVFYGDAEDGEGTSSNPTSFWIIASKQGHIFVKDTLSRDLSNTQSNVSQVNFIDKTVYSITGRVFQKCQGCLTQQEVPGTIESNLDGVEIFSQNTSRMKTSFLPSSNQYGSYAITVLTQGNYRIRPKLEGRRFLPDSSVVSVIGNLSNVNFEDTTRHVISGRIGDGCKVQIGEAVLEFKDVLLDKNGRLRASEFRKRVTTSNGFYSLKMPARKYQVSVISFTALPGPNAIAEIDFKAFFNTNSDSGRAKTAIPYDSLLVDISNGDGELNLFFQRRPELELVNLDNEVCNSTNLSFVIFPQSKPKAYQVKVWQGPRNLGCKLNDDSVVINTNIQKDDENERRVFKVKNGMIADSLVGGTPNILSQLGFSKTFVVSYTDNFGRPAPTLRKTAVVTGVKADNASSFATTSPQIPLMVLHDPPGDQSSSFWETNKTSETAFRMSVASEKSTGGWAEVKLGTSFSAGLGVEVETSIWGTVNSSLDVTARINNSREAILSTTTTQNISTSSDEDVTGDDGDLFIGSALNLLYTRAYEVKLNDQCFLEAPKRLMIAQNGFGTQFIYTAAAIRDNVIPTLKSFIGNPGNSEAENNNFRNQVKVWEQVLANNEINKKRSTFDKNISFFGSSGPIANSTTTSTTGTSSIEYEMAIDLGLAVELGFEIGGSGLSGGVNVRFRTEMGNSITQSNTSSTTIGYTLDDNDALDNFSVNVRKDPVYNTPVFQTVAGQSSCPPENNTLARDEPFLVITNPEVTAPATQDAVFNFNLANTSIDVNPRTYLFGFDQSTNPFGANISVGGIPMGVNPIPYTIGQNDVVPVTVNVKRNSSNNAFTYEGLQFYLTDACTGDVVKTATVSARFEVPCSPITLVSPSENWVCTQTNNNIIPVHFNGYNISALHSVVLEFAKVGTTNWRSAFSRNASDLNTGPNGTIINWNVSNIADGQYNIRIKVTCSSGITYTERVSGLIDRTAPMVLGVPQPSDAVFSVGDEISFSYNENLEVRNLNENKVELRLVTGNILIPSSVTGFENKLVVVPTVNLMAYSGQLVRLVVKDIPDGYGNAKTQPDTLVFSIGTFTPSTSNKALQVSLSPSNLTETASGSFAFLFSLPAKSPNDVQVNFNVGGTAGFGADFTGDFSHANSLNAFDGTSGRVIIPRNSDSVYVFLKPLTDGVLESDETIMITLASGGDYQIGTIYSATATIIDNSIAPPTITGASRFCPGTTTVLTANHPLAGNSGYTFLWSNGDTTQSVTVSQPGNYSVKIKETLTGLEGNSAPFALGMYALPNTQAGPDFSITQNSGNILLGGSPTGGSWTGTGISGNMFNSNQALGAYPLSYCFTSSDGCTKCDTVLVTVTAIPLPPVANPVFTPGAGTFANPVSVSISCSTIGSSIYYTTNGTTPLVGTNFTFLYTGPIQVNQTTNIKAIGVLNGAPNSGISSGFFTISNPSIVATPTISPGTGTYAGSRLVSITTSTPGAEIYFTTTGNNPVIGTGFTRLYTGPFWVTASLTIRALGVKSGTTNSGIATAFITITNNAPTAPDPVTISPAPGVFTQAQTVVLEYGDPDAVLYYTLDGTEPVPDAPNTFAYSGPFLLSESATIVAVALKNSQFQGLLDPAPFTISEVTSTLEQEDEARFSIYPNPSETGLFQVLTQENGKRENWFEVSGLDGKTIQKGQLLSGTQTIDLGTFPTGLYLFRAMVNGKMQIHRLVRK